VLQFIDVDFSDEEQLLKANKITTPTVKINDFMFFKFYG